MPYLTLFDEILLRVEISTEGDCRDKFPAIVVCSSQCLGLPARVVARLGVEAGGDAARDAVRRVPCGAHPAQRPKPLGALLHTCGSVLLVIQSRI